MQVKLVVTKEDNPSYQHSYDFDQEVITIGRDNSNLLYLPDPKRIVGRSHAKLERKGDAVYLIDVGSKNFTFLMGNKIDAGRPYIIQEGDQFKIGGFLIKFEGIKKESIKTEPVDKTIFDPALPNPFLDDVERLAAILGQIYEKYELSEPGRRNEDLSIALLAEMGETKPINAIHIISSLMSPNHDALSLPEQLSIKDKNLSMTDRIRFLCDVLLTSLAKLIKAPWNFRLEFIGQTIIKSTKAFSFHSSTLQEIREFLLSGNISEDDFKNRVTILKKEIDEVMVHQVAFMDGYKISVNEGTRNLLDYFNPNALRKILDKQSLKLGRIELPYRYLPIFYHWKLLRLYQQRYLALVGEDKGIFEKKMFRSGFITGYLERLSSSRSDEASSKQQDDF